MRIIFVSPFILNNVCSRRLHYFCDNLSDKHEVKLICQGNRREIINARSDIIHVLKPHLRSAVLAILFKRKAKTVLDIDDYDPKILEEQGRNYEARLSRLLWEQLPKRFDTIISVTEEIKSVINGEVSEVITNGVDTDFFKQCEPLNLRNYWSELEDKTLLTYCGNLGSFARTSPVIEAFREIANTHPDARLMVIGDGKDKQELMDFARNLGVADKCIFTGRIQYENIPLYLSTADILFDLRFAESARMVGCGMKGFEYLGMGKVIIASKCSVMTHKNSYPVDSIQDAVNAFERITDNPKEARQRAKQARKDAVEKYDWKVLSKKLEGIYEKVIE